MTRVDGLVGCRPTPESVANVTCPPYDVIKPGTPLEKLVFSREKAIAHVTLGDDPKAAFEKLINDGTLAIDNEPCFYVYEQTHSKGVRLGVMAATEVSEYSEKHVIRHEKTFDHKVKGRVRLNEATGHTLGPVFLLTKAAIGEVLERIVDDGRGLLYQFESDFDGLGDLHGIRNRVFRVEAQSKDGIEIQSLIAEHPLYIADGHHRYHAALRNNQTHLLSYIVEGAEIEAYNRVIKGTISFDHIKPKLGDKLKPVDQFHTPSKHCFCVYHNAQSYLLSADLVGEDVVGGLDCHILERELYPLLGLSHSQIADNAHFDYYPESALEDMKKVVDSKKYDIAVALHPVSIDELMTVADAGLDDSDIVMPEKSTFFAPKILTGLFCYRHAKK